jgi:sugar phosphate isomerase/epimerase
MNKRRSFLRHAGLLSAGVFLTPAIISCSSNTETQEETTADTATETGAGAATASTALGLQLYSLRDQISKDVKGVIAKVAEAGYKKVETYGYSKENGFFGLQASAFSDLLKSHNLTTPSGHYGLDDFIASGNTDMLNAYIEAANATGQTYITVPYLGDKLRTSADDYKNVAAKLNQAAEICQKSNLKLAYHNHDFEFKQFGNTTGYDILLQETDPELVKFEIDLYWAYRAEKDPAAMMEQHPGRFVMWHVKDMDKNDPKLNTEIGSGSIDYKSLFDKAHASAEHIFVEQENFAANMDPYQSIKQSHDYIANTLLS